MWLKKSKQKTPVILHSTICFFKNLIFEAHKHYSLSNRSSASHTFSLLSFSLCLFPLRFFPISHPPYFTLLPIFPSLNPLLLIGFIHPFLFINWTAVAEFDWLEANQLNSHASLLSVTLTDTHTQTQSPFSHVHLRLSERLLLKTSTIFFPFSLAHMHPSIPPFTLSPWACSPLCQQLT